LPDLFTPYYLLFDLLLASITPLLYCFAAAYVILGEVDDGISRYLVVTPLGKSGYLISRLGLPTIIAFIISIAALYYFRLSDIAFVNIIIISLMTSLLGLVEALLVVSLAGNKVEGMAVSKLSGLFFLGLPAPFFISSKVQYLLFLLPSFWVSKYAMEQQLWSAVIGFLVTFGWITLLYQRFKNKTVR
jgi:fluoroquinolone transport system permease protein